MANNVWTALVPKDTKEFNNLNITPGGKWLRLIEVPNPADFANGIIRIYASGVKSDGTSVPLSISMFSLSSASLGTDGALLDVTPMGYTSLRTVYRSIIGSSDIFEAPDYTDAPDDNNIGSGGNTAAYSYGIMAARMECSNDLNSAYLQGFFFLPEILEEFTSYSLKVSIADRDNLNVLSAVEIVESETINSFDSLIAGKTIYGRGSDKTSIVRIKTTLNSVINAMNSGGRFTLDFIGSKYIAFSGYKLDYCKLAIGAGSSNNNDFESSILPLNKGITMSKSYTVAEIYDLFKDTASFNVSSGAGEFISYEVKISYSDIILVDAVPEEGVTPAKLYLSNANPDDSIYTVASEQADIYSSQWAIDSSSTVNIEFEFPKIFDTFTVDGAVNNLGEASLFIGEASLSKIYTQFVLTRTFSADITR